MALATLALSLMTAQQLSMTPRFELQAPLPTVPGVMMDTFASGVGLAQQTARARNLQGRILWVDATANLDRYNTEEKIVALVKQIKDTGFNTIVFDVKPISGHVVYPSKLAPKLTSWRTQTMPEEFDPLRYFVREAKANRITLFVSLNAFSEGHRMFLVGPGYNRPEQQTILYESKPVLSVAGVSFPLADRAGVVQENVISVLTTTAQVPSGVADAFAVTLFKNGVVNDGFNFGGIGEGVPTIPRGGVALYGVGPAAEFLRTHALPGRKLQFDSEAEYVPISARPEQQYPLMMNPADPDVQKYAFDILRELVTEYDVQGVIYDDRLRYGNLNADFSELSRRLFEKEIGRPVQWPEDVYTWTYTQNLVKGIRPGRYYDQWIAWRAKVIRDFVRDARQTVTSIRPTIQFGSYVGSWYGEYPRLGHNYASPEAQAGFWFATPNYMSMGTAPLMDFIVTGAYYPVSTVFEAMTKGANIGATVESAGTLTNRLVRDQAWTYAGIMLSDFADDPDGLTNALQAACAATQGVMVFDLSHNIDPMWPVFARAFASRREAPHDQAGLLAEVRSRRAALDKAGVKEPPIIIAAGSAGTGH